MKEITITVPDGKKAEWVNGVLTLIDEEVKDKRPVMERIKSFEDAMAVLEESHPLVIQYKEIYDNFLENGGDGVKDIVAYLKLRIIASALNEGWEPQFTEDEYRFYPWFTLCTEEELKEKSNEWKAGNALWLFGGRSASASACGLAAAYSNYAFSNSNAYISARLAVKSEGLADYFGKQFIEIWADYVGPFNRRDTEE